MLPPFAPDEMCDKNEFVIRWTANYQIIFLHTELSGSSLIVSV